MINKLGEYFNSQEFINAVAKSGVDTSNLNKLYTVTGRLMQASLQYVRLTSAPDKEANFEGLTTFLYMLTDTARECGYKDYGHREFEKLRNNMLADALLMSHSVSVDQVDFFQYSQGMKSFIWDKVADTPIKVHSTNGANIDTIKQNGIDPNREFVELGTTQKITQIFQKYSPNAEPFGWLNINCDKKVFYAKGFEEAYSYAVRGPEWVSQFFGGSFAHSKNNPEYTPDAYVTRNKEGAMKNVRIMMDDFGLSKEERALVEEFAEICWDKYAEKSPVIIVVPEEKVNTFVMTDYEKDIASYIGAVEGGTLGDNDLRTTEVIDTTDATYIPVPDVNELSKAIEQARANNVYDLMPPEEELTTSPIPEPPSMSPEEMDAELDALKALLGIQDTPEPTDDFVYTNDAN